VFWKFDGRSWADALNDAGYSVWGFDFAGFGGSERYPEMKDEMARVGPPLGGAAEGAEEIARVVTYILARTKATRVSIVAHSRGTIPAGLFATQHPELVDRLVFFGPATQRQLEVLPDGLPSSTSASIPQSVGWQFIGHIVRTVRNDAMAAENSGCRRVEGTRPQTNFRAPRPGCPSELHRNASRRLSGDHVGEDGGVPAIEEAEAIRSTVSGAAMAPQLRKSEVMRRSRMRTMLPG